MLMDKSSKIRGISWQNARIHGGRSNSWILLIPQSPRKIDSITHNTQLPPQEPDSAHGVPICPNPKHASTQKVVLSRQ